eukprot:scaffold317_cov260-Pinguiococcus_pyrenoidosus.AAC.20
MGEEWTRAECVPRCPSAPRVSPFWFASAAQSVGCHRSIRGRDELQGPGQRSSLGQPADGRDDASEREEGRAEEHGAWAGPGAPVAGDGRASVRGNEGSRKESAEGRLPVPHLLGDVQLDAPPSPWHAGPLLHRVEEALPRLQRCLHALEKSAEAQAGSAARTRAAGSQHGSHAHLEGENPSASVRLRSRGILSCCALRYN